MMGSKKHLRIQGQLPIESNAAQQLQTRAKGSIDSYNQIVMRDLAILYGGEPGTPGLGYDKLTETVKQLEQNVLQLQQQVGMLVALIQSGGGITITTGGALPEQSATPVEAKTQESTEEEKQKMIKRSFDRGRRR